MYLKEEPERVKGYAPNIERKAEEQDVTFPSIMKIKRGEQQIMYTWVKFF